MSFQGVLAGAEGKSQLELAFRFWNHPTATSATNLVGGPVTVANVSINNGIVSTQIPVDPLWFDGNTRYLGISVDGGPELSPRVLVTAVPYAICADRLRDSVYLGTNGNVGIGTQIPNSSVGHFPTLHIEGASPGIKLRDIDSDDAAGFELYLNGQHLSILNNGIGDGGGRVPLKIGPDGKVGIGIGPVGSPEATLDVRGTTRTTVLQITSDRAAKRDFYVVNGKSLLTKLVSMPITTWSYTNTPEIRHIGPTAQDFKEAFGLGEDDKHIATVDADGVALASIQALHALLKEKDAIISKQQQQLDRIEQRLRALEDGALEDLKQSASPL